MVWAVMKQKIASYLELIKVDCFIRIIVLQHHITYNHHTTTLSNVLKGQQTLKGNTILSSFVMYA